MKSIYLFGIALLCAVSTLAQQKTTVKWGDDFKLRKGSSEISVITTDNSGVYLMELHEAVKEFYVVTARMGRSGTLIKVRPDLTKAYDHDYDKELKNKEFELFKPLGDHLFIFASATNKQRKTLELYAAKLDKNNGNLAGDWKLITSFEMQDKWSAPTYKIAYNADSAKMVIVQRVGTIGETQYMVQQIDDQLNVSGGVTLSNEYGPGTYQLSDVVYTLNHKIVMVGGIYDIVEGKKAKDKNYIFNHYNIRVYNESGQQESEINTSLNGKFQNSTKVLQENNKNLVLAAFYSNIKNSGKVDGLMVQRIDINDGKTISTNDREITASMLTKDENVSADDEDDDDSNEEKKSKKDKSSATDVEAFKMSKNMYFRNIFPTTDGGLIILAETFSSHTNTSTYYSPGVNNSPGTERTTSVTIYESGDIMLCKVAATGEVSWIQTLPKKQREKLVQHYGYAVTSGWGPGMSFFSTSEMPYHSGFGAVRSGHNINIFMNDNPKNATVTQAGQQVRTASAMTKSDCFMISVDEKTGALTRNQIFSNKDIPTAMPKSMVTIGNDVYMVGRSDKNVWKNRIAVGRITLK